MKSWNLLLAGLRWTDGVSQRAEVTLTLITAADWPLVVVKEIESPLQEADILPCVSDLAACGRMLIFVLIVGNIPYLKE